ncbi:Adenylosuccinate synthetase [Biscogniauxia marginata]|nr:Adenylosuccinate synthetase [Biscogniauxia marginata]
MTITVILGAKWGVSTRGEPNTADDTRAITILRTQKGKLVDGQCQEAQLCARAALEEKGLTAVHDRILVSDRVNVLLDLHMAVDGLEERELGDAAIGTTRRGTLPPGLHAGSSSSTSVISLQAFPNLNSGDNLGIGPCYQTSRAKVRRLADGYQKRFGELFEHDIKAKLGRFDECRETLKKYVVDGVSFMRSAQQSNTKIVVESANALMLDVDYGSYPFVTSSSTMLAGIIGRLTLNPKNITETVGVVKASTLKLNDNLRIGTKLQEIGREWGTSTGRRRRCGWLGTHNLKTLSNLVVVKYSNSINYYTSLNLTKLDVLDTFETIKIAIAYKIDGEELDSYPADLDILNRAEVVHHKMPGWQKPTTNARTYYDLPKAARDYVEYIEKFVGVKIKYIGTGPDREAMIQRA